MADYLPIVVLFAVATVFVLLSFVASSLLGPRQRRSAAKTAPYECGIVPHRDPAERFPVRFYLVAMIFVIFDIEIIFLYPWAVLFNRLGTFGLVEMALFSVAVLVSLVYLLANGALDWGPIVKLTDLEERVAGRLVGSGSGERTSGGTIRRVSKSAPLGADGGSGEAA